jgi:NADH-quinone oxidoreductase subunit K
VEIPVSGYLALSGVMFGVGTLGVVIKRNPIVVFMCIELMLNAANLAFLAFARYHRVPLPGQDAMQVHMTGQMAVIFVMAVAAAEVSIGLGIIMAIFRLRHEVDVDELSVMRG